MSSKKPTETTGDEHRFWTDGAGYGGNARLIPSSSEDLTLASITSETNGRNTAILNVTTKSNEILAQHKQNAKMAEATEAKEWEHTFIP